MQSFDGLERSECPSEDGRELRLDQLESSDVDALARISKAQMSCDLSYRRRCRVGYKTSARAKVWEAVEIREMRTSRTPKLAKSDN